MYQGTMDFVDLWYSLIMDPNAQLKRAGTGQSYKEINTLIHDDYDLTITYMHHTVGADTEDMRRGDSQCEHVLDDSYISVAD